MATHPETLATAAQAASSQTPARAETKQLLSLG